MESRTTIFADRNPAIRIVAGAISLLWVLFVILDILAWRAGSVSPVTIWLKGTASCLVALLSWIVWKDSGSRPLDALRAVGFSLAFLGDVAVLLNTYRVLEAPLVFAIGGYLFVPALLAIATRNASGFSFLFDSGKLRGREIAIALSFYLPLAILLLLLGKALTGVGLLILGIVYGTCLVTVLWTGWAAVRKRLHPPPRNAMIAIGATLVFVMELVGTIYNLKVPGLSDIAFFATWIIYVPGMLLMALA